MDTNFAIFAAIVVIFVNVSLAGLNIAYGDKELRVCNMFFSFVVVCLCALLIVNASDSNNEKKTKQNTKQKFDTVFYKLKNNSDTTYYFIKQKKIIKNTSYKL